MLQRHLTSSLPIVALTVLLAIHLRAGSRYTFTRIADTRGFPGGIQAPVALNDAGQMAFVAAPTDAVTGVFVGNGHALTTAADTTRTFTFFGFPGINGLGQATFFAAKSNQRRGHYAGLDGAVTIVEDRGAVHSFAGDVFSSPSGSFSTTEVVLSLPRSAQAIVASEGGGRAIRVADTSGPFQLLDFDPRVNAAGLVAFHATRRDFTEGIFVGKGGALTTIADTSGPFLSFKDSPAINDRGEVLFQAEVNAANGTRISGLFLSSHGRIRTVVDSTGAFLDFGSAPGLNSEGQIAFVGITRDLVGIFTGGDPVADRVIALNDPIDGSTVSRVGTFWSSLNNAGQIAFLVDLADGRTAIYRADPR